MLWSVCVVCVCVGTSVCWSSCGKERGSGEGEAATGADQATTCSAGCPRTAAEGTLSPSLSHCPTTPQASPPPPSLSHCTTPPPQASRQHQAKQVALDWQKSLSGGRLWGPADGARGGGVNEEVMEGVNDAEPVPVQQQAQRDRCLLHCRSRAEPYSW